MENIILLEVEIVNTEQLRSSIDVTGLIANFKKQEIEVQFDLINNAKGIGPAKAPGKMIVNNTTDVPVVNPDGTPYMVDNWVTLGHQVKDVLDEEGNPTGETEYDLESPIKENRPYQLTIGEYDKVIWEIFDKRNPASLAVEIILTQGILRWMKVPGNELKFTATPEWLATQNAD
jgi:hypothetical protein